ncbi:MAG: preprotein translocase subunit SecE [Bauldia sp.]|nr:preprotein translocase subunit SecE [Bauldia sp.]
MAERTNPFTFLQQVRAEVAKVVWPTRRETVISTIMVFVFATIAAIFFLIVDGVLGAGSRCILGDGSNCPFGMSPWLLVGVVAAIAALGYIAWSFNQSRKNQ